MCHQQLALTQGLGRLELIIPEMPYQIVRSRPYCQASGSPNQSPRAVQRLQALVLVLELELPTELARQPTRLEQLQGLVVA